MKSIDYSDRAIAMRLQRVSQLRRVCLSLAKAKPANHQPSTANPPRD